MSSLKTFAPYLAPRLDLTANALYERQRALVRAGLLRGKAGRGPGSGVEATRENVALLILASLATDQLTDFADAAADILSARSNPDWQCPITGCNSPVAALADMMMSRPRLRQLHSIQCFRFYRQFEFRYSRREDPSRSDVGFFCDHNKGLVPSIFVSAEMPAKATLHEIAEALPGHVLKESDNG